MNARFLGTFPLSEILRQHDEEEAPPARPLMEAQRMELLQRYAAATAPCSVRPGMLVREKRGLGHMKDQENTAIMLWRMLDLTNPLDLKQAEQWVTSKAVSSVDCLIAFTAQDDGFSTVVIMPHDTAHLEPAD